MNNLNFRLLFALSVFDRHLISASQLPALIYYGIEFDRAPESFDCIFQRDYDDLTEEEKEERRVVFLQSVKAVQDLSNFCLN